jgi:hypothetical protein
MTGSAERKYTVYVSIGNSDDKLTQADWSLFVDETYEAIARQSHVHGVWTSASADRYQNACFCFELPAERIGKVKDALARVAAEYRQDSIAWADAETTFITPAT